MTDTGSIIEAVGLKKRFGLTMALEGVTISLAQGERVCIIGPNGAGKTTLLLLLGGVILPSAGHVHVFGLHRWKQNYEIRKRSTFLTADPLFGASPTPYEYLRFYAQIYQVPKETFLERVRRMADEMNMTPHLKKPWPKLSLGMAKKTGLIAAFLPDAELRILDEPFAGGVDPMAMEQLYLWMEAAKARGETILFSTQVLEQAEHAADRMILLRDASIAADGTPQEIIAQAGVLPDEPRPLSKAFLKLVGYKGEE